MLKKMLSGLFAVLILWGGFAGMAENVLAEDDWYKEVRQNAQMRLGNNLRIKRVIQRAQAGEVVTVAFIGGSITEGAGASQYKECYAYRVFQGFRERYGAGDGSNVHSVNAGVGGTPSTFGLMRYQRDIVDRVNDSDGLPDLVIVEFAVNDYNEPTKHRCYESLVKTILTQENDPAVILLFSVFDGGFNLQSELKAVGDAYDLMMVSIKNAAYPHVGKEWSAKEFFFDAYHPTSMGHGVMADCLLYAVEQANRAERASQDIDLNAPSAYGTDYMGLKSIYGEGEYPGVQLERGGFSSDDTGSYSNLPVGRVCGKNFYHSAVDSNEPLRLTAVFKKLLIAWKASPDAQFGEAQIIVDGEVRRNLKGAADKWGQSEVVMIWDAKEAAEHTLEIRMAEGSEGKRFTVTCIGIVE